MAPWPEQGTETKTPDKEEKGDVGNTIYTVENEESSENSLACRSEQTPKQIEEKEVLTLDEGQLRALLDEAITYKNPKDREGKSELFKELLQEAEADESNSKGLGSSLSAKLPRSYNLPVRRRHPRHQGRECGVGVSTTRGGSLQNLHALGMGGGRRRSGRSGDTLVSARQREGGSLPTNVNVDNDADLDGIICPNYTSRATLEVSGSCKDDNGIVEDSNNLALFQGNCVPSGTEHLQPGPNYNTSTRSSGQNPTKDDDIDNKFASTMSVSPLETGPVSYPVNPVTQHVSMFNIPPPQIQIGPDPSTKMSTFGKDGDTKTRSWDVDQNQNSVGCLRMDSNCMDRKKTRRVKTKNDRKYIEITSENIEGFRGGADIDTLMEYIESPSNILDKASKARANQSNGPRNHVKVRAKEEDSRPIKRRTKEKFQRCNSLEEISKTKLEDLTEESSSERVNGSQQALSQVQVTVDDTQINKKSTWGDEADVEKSSSTVMKRTKELNKDRNSPDAIQDSEFHVVTKKQRKKKRRTGCSGRLGGSKQTYYSGRGFPAHDRTLEQGGTSGLLYQYRSRGEKDNTQPRRKSASSVPPSDKSDSSDLDSVHSLPVSSTTSRTKVGKNSVSGGSTPQASYADIARTMASPPDIDHGKYSPYLPSTGADLDESSCDHPEPSALLPSILSLKKDAMTDTTCDITKPALHKEEYPPLDIKSADIFLDSSIKPRNTPTRDNTGFENHTKTILYVIPISSESGTGPRSTSVHTPSACIKPFTESDCKRPPVILMDEPIANSQIPSELTFGFEVNQQLLQCEESTCSLNSVSAQHAFHNDTQQTFPADSYWRRVIAYLATAWEDTMRDLQLGRAKYYDEH
ncbi:uncharacterized protein LOC124369299 isoform X2 [Homalodisca vitripennis]|uniref:uncharacterized protein LOC124369299 isoform X2 n=1 Tax=Homalodisca vitripennis TaxID=197043 RepID=UPI001EEAF399|nr:uncharacterized protein LOC124369299 isoform X2 [Homalodisca vitripennis]